MQAILFVCLANICRSPAAEAVMKKLLKENGLTEQVHCDSAGISAYHAGRPADARMRGHGTARGLELNSISRPFHPGDFDAFDYVIAMDDSVYIELEAMMTPRQIPQKLYRFCSFCRHHDEIEVPDPYGGGHKGFERVFNIIEDGCAGLLVHVEASLDLANDQLNSSSRITTAGAASLFLERRAK